MKYLIFVLLIPCMLFSSDHEIELCVSSIYNHAKSEKLKYECLVKKNNPHDINMVYYGKKDAYEEMMKFISAYHHIIDN